MNDIMFSICMAIAFIIPGFIIIGVTERNIPKRKKDYNLKLLDFFIYSFINAILWAIPIYSIYLNFDWWKIHYIRLWLSIILITIVSPFTISLIIICLNKYDCIRKICNYFDINLIELEPSAWDYKFSKIEAEWVIVTLTDDSVIAGFMGGLSFASSNEGERDIYINEVYKIDDDNNWKIQTDTNGILIKAENIKYIEFFKRKEKENEQQFKEKCSKKYIKSYKK